MNTQSSVLLTDLYQLTMLDSYYQQGMVDTAVFEFFVRRLSRCRNFLIAAGLEQVLAYLENLSFTDEELDWIKQSGRFSATFADHLSDMRFTGEVHAMPEGRVFFADEPILRITAPLPEAQLVESRIINILNFQSMVASKAARCVLSAPDKLLVDFGMRRAHGAEAGLMAARAGYIAGLAGTATVLAGVQFDIPVFGTMAHSFVQAHDDELAAFKTFAQTQPDNIILLIDTYDTESAARKVAALADQLIKDDIRIKGVRIDSGDLSSHARKVRQILDTAGHAEISIFASSSLDEFVLQDYITEEVPIDGFGIGTHMDTSEDRPYLDCAYKLQEYAGIPRRKRSEGKATWPGRKQIYRYLDDQGQFDHDVLTLDDDKQAMEGLIIPVMKNGKRLTPPDSLTEIRERCANQLAQLSTCLRSIDEQCEYDIHISLSLQRLAQAIDQHGSEYREVDRAAEP